MCSGPDVADGEADATGPDVRRFTYELGREPPSAAVIEAIGAVTDTDPMELDPLGRSIDPDNLDGLFAPATPEGGDARVTFAYHGHEVTVHASGIIRIRSLDASSALPERTADPLDDRAEE